MACQSPSRGETWTTGLLFAAISSLALALLAFPQYYRLLLLRARVWNPLGDDLAIFGLTLATELLVLLPVLALFGLLVAAGWRRAGLAWLALSWGLLFEWLGMDLLCQHFTGNHLLVYASMLPALMATGMEAANHVGGAAAIVVPLLGVGAATGVLGLVAWFSGRWLARRAPLRLLNLAVIALLGAAAATQLAWSEAPLAHRAEQQNAFQLGIVEPALALQSWLSPPVMLIAAVVPTPLGGFPPSVELFNPRPTPVDLVGWRLNSRGATMGLSGVIEGRSRKAVFHPRFTLGDRGDVLSLVDPQGRLQSRVQYSNIQTSPGWKVSFYEQEASHNLKELQASLKGDFERLHRALGEPVPVQAACQVKTRPDVLVFVVESLRPDTLLAEAPKLMARARKGIWLERHFTGSNTTPLAMFSIYYGRNPIFYRRDLDPAVGAPPQLVYSLQKSGYQTCFLGSPAFKSWRWVEHYLARFDLVELPDESLLAWTDWPLRDQHIQERAKALLNPQDKQRPPRLVVWYYNSTHYPYAYPPEFGHHRAGSEDAINLDNFGLLDRESLANRYKNSVGYLETLVEGLLTSIDLSNTVVIITGDHGESFGEDGVLSHGTKPSEVQLRTPCMIFGPGVPATTVKTATTHMDLVPTLLHILTGASVSIPGTQGRDLLGGNLQDQALVYPNCPCPPYELVLIKGEQKMLVRLNQPFNLLMDMGPDGGPTTFQVMGFLNSSGDLDPEHTLEAAEIPQWQQAFHEELGRLSQP